MANRNRTAAQLRHDRQNRKLEVGKPYFVQVESPVVKKGCLVDMVYFSAFLILEPDGRTVYEYTKQTAINRINKTRIYFSSFQINRDWWKISDIPVEISWHTRRPPCMTAVVMTQCWR